MTYLPVYIQSDKISVLLVGGGEIALRKLKGLYEADVKVDIITQHMSDEFSTYIHTKGLSVALRTYKEGDAAEYDLVIAATNHERVNDLVQRDASKLVCRVDDVEKGNILLPATIRRGALVLTVSTSSASPILVKKIKKDLEQQFDEAYESYVDFLAETRKKYRGNRKLLRALVDEQFINMTDLQRNDALKTLVQRYC